MACQTCFLDLGCIDIGNLLERLIPAFLLIFGGTSNSYFGHILGKQQTDDSYDHRNFVSGGSLESSVFNGR